MQRKRTRRHRVLMWVGGIMLVLVVALVAARIGLPFYLESYVNRTIDQSPDYTGRIGTIDVHLWRGAYTIHDLEIYKKTHNVPVPLYKAPEVDLSLYWGAILHHSLRGKIVMESPRLNFVHGPSTEETQTGAAQPWLGIIEGLYPFRIDRAVIHNGQVHFHTFHTSPPVDVYLSDVEAKLENLTNIQDKLDPLMATLTVRATAMHSGNVEMEMSLDPEARRPTFQLATRLLDLDVTKLNALAKAYGDFDFERGRFDLVVEVSAKDGHMDGYTKPLFRDVQVVGLRDLAKDNPLQFLWESLVGIIGAVFKNQDRDQFGTRITLQGDLDSPQTDILEVVGNVLRNAFVRAYLPQIEGRVAPKVTNAGESQE